MVAVACKHARTRAAACTCCCPRVKTRAGRITGSTQLATRSRSTQVGMAPAHAAARHCLGGHSAAHCALQVHARQRTMGCMHGTDGHARGCGSCTQMPRARLDCQLKQTLWPSRSWSALPRPGSPSRWGTRRCAHTQLNSSYPGFHASRARTHAHVQCTPCTHAHAVHTCPRRAHMPTRARAHARRWPAAPRPRCWQPSRPRASWCVAVCMRVSRLCSSLKFSSKLCANGGPRSNLRAASCGGAPAR